MKRTVASLLDAVRMYVKRLSAGAFSGTTRFKGELGVKLIKAKHEKPDIKNPWLRPSRYCIRTQR
jgi:hypothetical protein